MTDQDLTGGVDDVLTLQQLIRARMDERGWTYADLERRSGDRLTKGRWQQLGSGVRQKSFPEPTTVRIMADVLEVDVTTVILSAAQTLGLEVRRRGPDLAQLLPAGTDELSERMRDAILAIIRAAVAESLQREATAEAGQAGADVVLEWSDVDGSDRRARSGHPGRDIG